MYDEGWDSKGQGREECVLSGSLSSHEHPMCRNCCRHGMQMDRDVYCVVRYFWRHFDLRFAPRSDLPAPHMPSAERRADTREGATLRARSIAPREARRASRVLLDLVFGRIFVMAIYGRRIPIRCHHRASRFSLVRAGSQLSITNEQTVVGQKLTSTPRELQNMLWDGLYSQRRLTWYQSLDFRTICGVMMITSAVMTTTLIIGK